MVEIQAASLALSFVTPPCPSHSLLSAQSYVYRSTNTGLKGIVSVTEILGFPSQKIYHTAFLSLRVPVAQLQRGETSCISEECILLLKPVFSHFWSLYFHCP